MGSPEISDLEERLITLVYELGELSYEDDFLELVKVLHRPDWTTSAEFTLTGAVVEAMLAETRVLAGLKESLIAGSRQVIDNAE
jgi:hypothetical protein